MKLANALCRYLELANVVDIAKVAALRQELEPRA
jgi:hypothetical protein